MAAMNRQNNLLFAALGIMVAGLAVSGLVSGFTLRGLRVQRILSRHGAVGRPLVVRYAITNRYRPMMPIGPPESIRRSESRPFIKI